MRQYGRWKSRKIIAQNIDGFVHLPVKNAGNDLYIIPGKTVMHLKLNEYEKV